MYVLSNLSVESLERTQQNFPTICGAEGTREVFSFQVCDQQKVHNFRRRGLPGCMTHCNKKNKHAAKSAGKRPGEEQTKLKAAQQICCVVRVGGNRRHGRL